MDAECPSYTPAERRADAVVHAVGLTLGLAACAVLAAAACHYAAVLREIAAT